MSDRLGDLVRAADPGTVRRDDPLSERGLKELEKYRALEDELSRRRRNAPAKRPWWSR